MKVKLELLRRVDGVWDITYFLENGIGVEDLSTDEHMKLFFDMLLKTFHSEALKDYIIGRIQKERKRI